MPTALANPIIFLIQTLGGLYILAMLLRFLLQLVQADFYNQISQFIVKITNPLVSPLRKILPSGRHFDLSALLLALLLQALLSYLVLALSGISPTLLPVITVLMGAIFGLIMSLLNLYIFAIFIVAIASWVAPGSYNPGLVLLNQLVEPLSSRIRSIIPPMGGLDFSVMVLLIGIYMIKSYILLPAIISLVPPVIFNTVLLT